jgi:hypothetical protein
LNRGESTTDVIGEKKATLCGLINTDYGLIGSAIIFSKGSLASRTTNYASRANTRLTVSRHLAARPPTIRPARMA